jgi:hypothetical protein
VQQLPVWTARKHFEDAFVVYKLCNTDHEAGLNFLDLLGVHVGKVDPHSSCLAMKIGFNIVDK